MYLEIVSTLHLIVSVFILCILVSGGCEQELKPIDENIRKSMYS